jgi:hypothetical protein
MRSTRLPCAPASLAPAALALAALLALPALGSAQASDNIQATANVLTPLAVNGSDPLAFGDVLPGVTYTVAPGSANSGLFDISGAAGAPILLDFSLPSALTGPGVDIPITFGASSAQLADGGSTEDFDPSTSDYAANLNGSGVLDVFIGGEITPAQTQLQGAYSATITLSVVYSGS